MSDLTREDKKQLRQALLQKALEFESVWKQEVPVFRGRYKSSIESKIIEGSNMKAQVFTNIDYAKDLEFGLGAGQWPDVSELKKWVDRKLGVSEENLDTATFLIARHIFQQGIEKQAPLRSAIRKFKTQES